MKAMRKTPVLALVMTVALASPACAEDPPCKSKVAQACFTVRGALLAANGTPSFRIMVTETQRVLGIDGGENPPPPDAVRRELAPDMFSNRLSGDYSVCPQAEEHPGSMQMVCVRSASNLTLAPR